MAMKIDENLPKALYALADTEIPNALATLEAAGNDLKIAYNKNRDHIAQSGQVFGEIRKLITFCENFKGNMTVIQTGIRDTAAVVDAFLRKNLFT